MPLRTTPPGDKDRSVLAVPFPNASIEIDRHGKEITVVNNEPVYKAILNADIAPLQPEIHDILHAGIATIDEVLGWIIRFLVLASEVAYLQKACQWTVNLAARVNASAAEAVASATVPSVTTHPVSPE